MNGSGQNPICRIWVGSFDVGSQEEWASLQPGESLRYLPQLWPMDALLWTFSTDGLKHGLKHPSAENPTDFVLSRPFSTALTPGKKLLEQQREVSEKCFYCLP